MDRDLKAHLGGARCGLKVKFMNRADLLAHLAAVKRQVTVGQSLIDAQSAAGSDVTAAEKTLAALDRAQDLQLAEIEVILNELDKLPPFESEQ
jgi:hypothetical protein